MSRTMNEVMSGRRTPHSPPCNNLFYYSAIITQSYGNVIIDCDHKLPRHWPVVKTKPVLDSPLTKHRHLLIKTSSRCPFSEVARYCSINDAFLSLFLTYTHKMTNISSLYLFGSRFQSIYLFFSFFAELGADVDKDLSNTLGLNHGMGRITGSASIETLVRVGIEKEHGLSPDSKMVVLHDFTPCVDDELEVKRGQIVNILYRENDWVYVIGQDTRQEGFIPHSYCAPYNTQLADMAIKKKLPRDQSLGAQTNGAPPADLIDGVPDISNDLLDDSTVSGLIGLQSSVLKHSQASLSSDQDFLPFAKDPSGRYIVLYTFIARDENDVSVERGEFVTVLNREDPEWFWIVRSDGQEGFIPSGFVYPAEHFMQATAKAAHMSDGSACVTAQQTMITQANGVPANPTMLGNGGHLDMTNANLIGGMVGVAVANAAALASTAVNGNGMVQAQTPAADGVDEMRYSGTELVMLYDYKVCYSIEQLRSCNANYFTYFFLCFRLFRHKHRMICRCAAVTGSTPTSTIRRWRAGYGRMHRRHESTVSYRRRMHEHRP